MRFGWLGRLAIVGALLAPLAIFVRCSLLFWPWTALEGRACVAVMSILGGGANSDAGGFPTPVSIIPPWPTLPFYAILRAFDDKLVGLIVTIGAIIAPLTIPFRRWSTTPARAWIALAGLVPILAGLGWTGAQEREGAALVISRVLIGAYFLLLLVAFPLLSKTRVARRSEA
jgi:quinol-cytochrome oxidoreductase complex cytochrome b subunit